MRRIFQSVLAGETIASIAKALRAEKIPIPSEHWKRAGEPVRAAKYADPYARSATTIGYILKRPEYMGRKVLGKTVCENYKTKSSRKTAPEEQYTFEGAIPAIVDVETWQTVQKIRETVRRAPKRQNAPNRLTGLLYCADCGSKLTHRYNLVQGKWVEDAFICSGYRHLIHDCTMHHIPTVKIEAAILAVIQRVSWYVRHNEKEFIERVREASDQNQEKTVKECKQKINKAQKRHKELKKARYEKRKAEKREFTARKKAGLLTPEESERLEAHKSRKKIAREKLVQQAATDPAAAAELAKKRAHQSQATKKSRQKMYEEAATGNPEAVERYENYLVTRRESYHRKKQEAERTA